MKKCSSYSICICFILIVVPFLIGCNATKSCSCCDYPLQTIYNHVDIDSIWIKDSDHDGVLDKYDKEPNSYEFAAVNRYGVTLDSDNDSCLDHEDPEPYSTMLLPITNCINASVSDFFDDYPSCRTLIDHWYMPMFFFYPGTTNEVGNQDDEFKFLLEMLKLYPSLFIEIDGVIPPDTEVSLARQIAEERANIIMNYLLDQGAAIEQLSIVGYSGNSSIILQYEPIANNRVEIHVIKH